MNGDKMSSILEIGENKTKCQKFTPSALVDTMLNLVNYNTDLMGKTILENSFGSGNILKAIVVRYIESASNTYDKLTKDDIDSLISAFKEIQENLNG